MARPLKSGLDYYPMDVDFLRDKKIRAIERANGPSSINVVVALFSEIYRSHGYYLEWDEFSVVDITSIAFFGRGDDRLIALVQNVVKTAISTNLFNRDIFEKYGVLTSEAIQSRYAKLVSRRKFIINSDFLLINVDNNEVNVDNNVHKSKVEETTLKKTTTTSSSEKKTYKDEIVSVDSFTQMMKEDYDLLERFMEDSNCGEESAVNMLDKFARDENDKPYKEKEFWKWKRDLSDWVPKKGIAWLRSTGRIAGVAKKNREMSQANESPIPSPIVKQTEAVKPSDDEKQSYAEFVLLTKEEHSRLVEEYGEEWTSWMIDKMSNYKGKNGIRNESDYHAIKFHGVKWMEEKRESDRKREDRSSESKRSKRKLSFDYYSNFDFSFVDPDVWPAFKLWLEYKLELGDTYQSDSTVKAPYRKLLGLIRPDEDRKERSAEIIDHAITSGWTGIYDDGKHKKQTNNTYGNKNKGDSQPVATSTVYDEAETFG